MFLGRWCEHALIGSLMPAWSISDVGSCHRRLCLLAFSSAPAQLLSHAFALLLQLAVGFIEAYATLVGSGRLCQVERKYVRLAQACLKHRLKCVWWCVHVLRGCKGGPGGRLRW